jgi:hypothetical protein
MDMAGVTREEAVLYLLSLQDQIDLIGENNLQSADNLQPLISSTQYPQLRIIRLRKAHAVRQNIWGSFCSCDFPAKSKKSARPRFEPRSIPCDSQVR